MSSKYNLDEIVRIIEDAQNITVFTGAGVSTNSGIPDFRGEKGLYSMIGQKYDLPYPEAVFDIQYFKQNPIPFFELSKDIFSEVHPTICHKFVAWLEEKGKISLVMTQNIDMLHQLAGSKKVLECHGTYTTAHCLSCEKAYTIEDIKDSLMAGQVPYCECTGIIKPDIVFFGEQLPMEFYKAYHMPPKTDLLMVFGTSLLVQPAANFPLKILDRYDCKTILVNFEPTPYDAGFEYVINEDLDAFCGKIWEALR